MRRRHLGLALGLGFTTFVLPSAALAEPRLHDGLFVQLSLGFGPGWLNEEAKDPSAVVVLGSDEVAMSAVTGMFEVLVGGTPVPGLVLGGALTGHSMVNPTMEVDGEKLETEDTSVGISQLSLFANWYPDPRQGFYLHGSVGYGSATVTVDDVTYDVESDGLVLGAGLGYDFWVGDEWSVGPQFRFTYAPLDSDAVSDTFISPILAFTATYH